MGSAADQLGVERRVAISLKLDFGGGFFEGAYIVLCEFDIGCAEILFEAFELRCAGDRNDPWLFGEEPRERDLRGSYLLVLGERTDHVDKGLVGFAVFLGEARDAATEVGAIESCGGIDLAGEKAFAEGAEGNKTDAEFFRRGQHRFFGLTPEERVLTLKRGDGLHGVGAADGGGAGFREAEMLDLALLDEAFDGAGDVFDRNLEVDAMLVVEVDRINLETLERFFRDLPDVVWMAVEGVPLAAVIGIGFPTKFCGDDDLSRKGARASPTSSSLTSGP